jgi:hypothetical protein
MRKTSNKNIYREDLNLRDKTIRLSLKFFEICAQNIILLTELGLHKELIPLDFQSVFILKNKLNELFKGEEDLIENKEIYEKSLVDLNDIHMDFIKGKYDEVRIFSFFENIYKK